MEKYYFYKFVCLDVNIKDIYIGSTLNFKRRYNGHHTKCTNSNDEAYNKKLYVFIRETGGWDNWKMEIIEEKEMPNNETARMYERYLCNLNKASLNMCKPQRTDKEYREDNREKLLQQHKEYYKRNKEEMLQKMKEHRKKPEIKEKIKQYKATPEYKNKKAEWDKKYRELYAEKIKASKSALKTCDICSKQITSSHFARHKRMHVN